MVKVGEVAVPPGVGTTQESPPGGGPAAGLLAGLAALPSGPAPWVLVLACDLVHPEQAVPALRAGAIPADRDGACLVDADGHQQWLAGCYRREALDAAAARAGDPQGLALGALLGALDLQELPAAGPAVADIDTWEDHRRWSTHPEGEDDDG